MTTQSNGNNAMVQGRIVWTSGKTPFEGKQKKDMNTNQPLVGPDGQPKIEYGFGLAIPKIDPTTGQNSEEYTKIWQALHQEAFTIYPQGRLPPDFAMKFKDGDGVDHNGKSFSTREGYAGHIILACTTMIPIKYFIYEGGQNVMVTTGIKNGDYVNVQLNIKAHPAVGRGKPGLYLNPGAVQLIQQGKEIINTPSGDQIFGQNVPAYSGQAVADTPAPMPNAQGLPQQPMGQPPMQQQPVAQPHYDVLPNQMQPNGLPQQPMGQQPTGQPPMPQQPMGQPPMPQQPTGQPPMPQQPMGQQMGQPPMQPNGMPQQQGLPPMPQ